jgi:hypothetical protein
MDKEQIKKENDRIVRICDDAGHLKEYDTEAEYRGQCGYAKEYMIVWFEDFTNNPSAPNWQAFERAMILYQNLIKNCTWRNA